MTASPSRCPSQDEKVVLVGLLLETNARLSKELGAELDETCQLPLAWFEVLLQLRQAPEGRMKMTQMAEAIVHSTGGTTRLVDRLEVAGFVQRQSCPSDRRAIYIAPTAAGNAKLDDALGAHLAYLNDHLAERLSLVERRALAELLHKLNSPR